MISNYDWEVKTISISYDYTISYFSLHISLKLQTKKHPTPPTPHPPLRGSNFIFFGISLYIILCITGCQDPLGSSTPSRRSQNVNCCKIFVCISDAWPHFSSIFPTRKNASIRPLHLNTMFFHHVWCFFASFASIYDGLLNFDQIFSGTFCKSYRIKARHTYIYQICAHMHKI